MHPAHPQLFPRAVPAEAHLYPPRHDEGKLRLRRRLRRGLRELPPGHDRARPALQHDGRLGEADADAYVVLGLLGQPLQDCAIIMFCCMFSLVYVVVAVIVRDIGMTQANTDKRKGRREGRT